MDSDMQLDAAFIRGLTQRRLSRGEMLKATGAGIGSLSLASLLAACGTGGASGTSGSGATAVGSTAWWDKQKKGSTLSFANWPLYIDKTQKNGRTDHPSLDKFTNATGIKVHYQEVIQSYESFFGKIRPSLAAGQSIGYDLIIMGYPKWLGLMIQLGYLVPLDHAKLPNFNKNAASFAKNPFYDPGNRYSVPWQTGLTAIGYNPKLTGRPITSLQDLMDPAFRGKIGMFGDITDMPNTALLAVGVNPTKATVSDWHKAANWLQRQKNAGLVRQYYDQDYIDALTKGDVWLSMAYSGDIYQANLSGAHLEFVVPKEGALLWADCMCIPKHASNPLGALDLMDFVYKPDIAAMITEYIDYITPVATAKQAILKNAAQASSLSEKKSLRSLASSELVFPTKADSAKFHFYANVPNSKQQEWNNLFEPIYQS
ncbi:MAG TPA: spermidine/putrescine ABC transporter substrate-binding protein [Chloroflexota bacterium]|nr:spermidine/putrescine ABC transporter substrate-binding protein [Chloroflexota bacterium]